MLKKRTSSEMESDLNQAEAGKKLKTPEAEIKTTLPEMDSKLTDVKYSPSPLFWKSAFLPLGRRPEYFRCWNLGDSGEPIENKENKPRI